jgi:hypothetical protein
MELLVAFVIVPALLGICGGRWTRRHPLLLGLIVGLICGAIGMIALGVVASPYVAAAVPIVGIVSTSAASLGAFIGGSRGAAVDRRE